MSRLEIALKGPEHKALAVWAAQCAEHVLRLFEKQHPQDPRPRKAVEALRTWIRTTA